MDAATLPCRRRVAQVAYAVEDVAAAAVAFAGRTGAGPFFVAHHPPLACRDGRGRSGTFHHSSAYGQWGEIQVELVAIHDRPVTPGLHHVAWFAPDLEAERLRLAAAGWPLEMWATTSSGTEFAFFDARAELGHLVEVYEPVPRLLGLYASVAAAARGWDGADPVRSLASLTERTTVRPECSRCSTEMDA